MSSTAKTSFAPVHAATERRSPLHVVIMDLLSIVPYYDGHLYAALAGTHNVELTLAAITYQHDRTYFARERIRLRPGLDIAGRLSLPKMLARTAKGVEATVNLALLAVRLAVSRPEVLHVQFMPLWEIGVPFEWWVVRLARLLGTKVVHTVHNVLPAPDEGKPLEYYTRRYRRVYRFADALICHGEETRGRLIREFGVPKERTTVIPHGPLFAQVNPRPRAVARTRLGIEPESVLVLWQGILRPYKGVTYLLNAWQEVAAAHPAARLAIVGAGSPEMNASVRKQVSEFGLHDSVRLELRFVSVEEMADWYAAADVLVYPYAAATTSGALMTGLNYAKTVVASDLPAFRQVIRNEENGFLVPYGDLAALRSTLERVLARPDLRERMADHVRRSLASEPPWPAIAQATLDCYRKAVFAVPL